MSTKATAARIYEYGEPDVFRFETMDVERRHHERCVAWRAWRRSWRGRRELDIIRPYRTFRRAAVGTAWLSRTWMYFEWATLRDQEARVRVTQVVEPNPVKLRPRTVRPQS